MKILFVAPRLPVPADTGGKIRTFNLLKQIAKKAETRLVCFSFEKEDKGLANELDKNLGILTSLIPMLPLGLINNIKNVLADPLPYSIIKYYSPAMEETLTSFKAIGTFDAVHIDHLHMGHYIKCLSPLPCILDEHNVEYRILERCAKFERSFFKRCFFSQQVLKMKTFEASKIQECSQFCAVSDDDRKDLLTLGQGKAKGHTIANGVDTEYFHPQAFTSMEEESSLVFTGSMDWLPNEDAVLFFCKDILPLIWKDKPEVKFYVVGKAPSSAIQELARKDPRIIVTGRVDDVRPIMAKAKVFVVPMRVGGGTRLKILEAMAMQKAVVSTKVGAEGIQYTEGKNILIGDSPEAFAKQVIAALNDSAKTTEIGILARDLVCRQYDWNSIGERLWSIYAKFA